MSQALTIIQQGDQYAIEVVVKNGEDIVTPETCDDMRIKLGEYTRSYGAGELVCEDGVWRFPMTQEMSLSFRKGMTTLQAQFKDGAEVRGTSVYPVEVDLSVLREVWL